MEKKKTITNSEWIDNETFVVNFAPQATTKDFELKGVTEEVVAEYYKDENKWSLCKQYYDSHGGFIDETKDEFTPYEKAEYMTLAEYEYKHFNCNDSWEGIVVVDNYEKYDALMDSVKNYYAKDNDNIAHDVEKIFNAHFIELLSVLDDKYKPKTT